MLVQQTVSQVQSDGRAAIAQPASAERLPEPRAEARTQPAKETEKTFFSKEDRAVGENSSRARLSLDQEERRVVVEIIDPETGDVITRFPPEQISDHIDHVLEETNNQTNLGESGLILDQTV